MINAIDKMKYVLLAGLAFVACETFETDLEVENLEAPNDLILTSDPVALQGTAASLYQNFYMTVSEYGGPGMALNTMADASSCSWGNVGMRDLSSEPRVAFNNGPSYSNGFITNDYFNSLYSVLSDANTLALAVENGTDFDNPLLIQTIAKFGQALAIGYNALVFDRVWVSDENGPVTEGANEDGSHPYNVAMTVALAKLDEAIAIARGNSFSVDNSYFNAGGELSSAELAEIMSSYGARMLANNARNTTERDATDWSRVLAYANGGVTSDYQIYHDDVVWYDLFKTYLVYPGWARIDSRVINMMTDQVPAYWAGGVNSDAHAAIVADAATDDRLASDYEFLASQNFRPERGEYHYSSYRYSRWDTYISEWTVPTVEVPASEINIYKAEALMRTGNVAGAADAINSGARVNRGGLAPVAANAADVAAAIHHERLVENPISTMGISFFEMRKNNLLQSGTLLHFPVPGKALESAQIDNYTFGGTSGVAGQDYSSGGWR